MDCVHLYYISYHTSSELLNMLRLGQFQVHDYVPLPTYFSCIVHVSLHYVTLHLHYTFTSGVKGQEVEEDFLDFLPLEDGTHTFSRNVGTELPLNAA